MVAERAGERDALRRDTGALREQFRPSIERGFGELNRAHVGPIVEKPRGALVQHISEGAANLFDPADLACEFGLYHAVFRHDTGQEHLGDRLDNSRTANACDGERRSRRLEVRLVGSQIAADHLEPGLKRDAVDAPTLDCA